MKTLILQKRKKEKKMHMWFNPKGLVNVEPNQVNLGKNIFWTIWILDPQKRTVHEWT